MPAPGDENREPRAFRSWDELREARGLPPRPEAEERGWRLERSAPPLPAIPSACADAVRRRIDTRPYAFGAMPTGPDTYRDPESDELSLLWSFRMRTSWPDDVLQELENLEPSGDDDRVDLTALPTCTIDGPRARDFDDAVSSRPLPGGEHELGVHIADVSAFVRAGTALDDEALARATSVYLEDQVVPMLPELLSNDLCSLRPHELRRCFSVICVFDAEGHRRSARFARSWIRSRARLEYGEVQSFLDARAPAGTASVPSELFETLRGLARFTQQQQRLRDARGSLRMQSEERVFTFGAEGRPLEVRTEPRYFAHALVEECALAANQAVGDELRRAGVPGLYRHHPQKDPEEIRAIARHLEEHGLTIHDPERVTGREIGELVRLARRRPNAESLIARIMGLVETAEYRGFARDEEARHFGLARRSYLHFTSPIRRYPDLVVHRWLARVLAAERAGERTSFAAGEFAELCEIAAHCSLRSRLADQAERAIFDLFGCEVLQAHVGAERQVRILRVSPYGLDVRTSHEGVDAHVPIRVLGRRQSIEGPTLLVHSGGRLRRFTEGQTLRARILAVDFQALQAFLEPL